MIPLISAVLTVMMMIWSAAAHAGDAIHPTTDGVIRVCWHWNMTASENCHKYHHIKLPSSIADGDTFRVEYGSNPKGYQFRVGRIAIQGGVCSIYSGQTGHLRDRIKVGCEDAAR